MPLNSKLILQERRKRKLSQLQLAEECGVSQTTLSNIESNKFDTIRLSVAEKLASYFEIPIEKLILPSI